MKWITKWQVQYQITQHETNGDGAEIGSESVICFDSEYPALGLEDAKARCAQIQKDRWYSFPFIVEVHKLEQE